MLSRPKRGRGREEENRNNRKGDRSPEQANLRLAKDPRRPSHLFFIQHHMGVSEDCWKPYIFLN